MIGRTHRFHGYGSLRGVYRRGKTVRVAHLGLRYATRDPNKSYRVAVVVSRKVNKSAVVRNRIRRRIYEAVRAGAAGISPGTDLVFTVFDDQVAELPAVKLQESINGLLQKARSQSAERR